MKNTYRIVAKFEYNNNKYFITMVNDNKIVVVKYDENKNISTDFSDEEYEMLNTVYRSLLIDRKSSVYIKDERIKNNLYRIFYDTKSKNYFWDSINGQNNEDDNKILNFKYNMMTSIYCSDEESFNQKMEELQKQTLEQLEKIGRPLQDDGEAKNSSDETLIDAEELEEVDEVDTVPEPPEDKEDNINEDTKEADEESLEDMLKRTIEKVKAKKAIENLQRTVEYHQGEGTNKNSLEATMRLRKIDPQDLDDQENSDKKDTGYYKKYIKFKKKILPIMISATMLLTPIIDAIVLGAQGKKEERISKDLSGGISKIIEMAEKNVNYDYSEIEQAIDSNENLTDEEKEYIKKFKTVFDKDHAYMDLELIKHRLSTLKINYNPETFESFSLLAGTYNELTNEITMNGVDEFKNVNKADFAHELFHVYQDSSQRYIMELINEAYKREKLREMEDSGISVSNAVDSDLDFGNGYSDHIYIYYILASMMDKNSIKQYQYTCDDEIIVAKLCEIDNNVESDVARQNAYQLLNSIDNLRVWDDKKQEYIINPEAEEECKKRLNYYYLQKNGMKIEEDLNCVIHKIYYNENTYKAVETTLMSEIADSTTDDSNILMPWKKVLPKTYLSDNHPLVSITFSSPELGTIEITNDLCEKYRENYRKEKQHNMER